MNNNNNNMNNENTNIILDTFCVQFSIAQLRRQMTVSCTLFRCIEECNWKGRLQSDVPPGSGILWPRAVLHQVSMTCTDVRSTWHLQSDIPRSDVNPHRGILWPRMVLSSNVLWVQILVICFSTIGEASHTLQCRRMSTVIQYILVLENWSGHSCRVILLLLLLLCNFVVATTPNYTWKTTRTKR